MLFQKLSGKRANTAPNISPGAAKTLWSWGYSATNGSNSQGQVGDSAAISRSSPVQLGTLASWSVLATGNSSYTGMAIKNDGTLWCWGDNSMGELGLGDTALRSSPTQIGTLGTWASMSTGAFCAVATKTDGTLWSWGKSTAGNANLGLGDTINRSSPTQIGTLATWSRATAGRWHMMAIKTDGTLWTWGTNTYGELGLGDLISRSSPVQIGALTTWAAISGGSRTSFSIRTDGTLWAWGHNGNGGARLGIGDAIYRSSPTQIGTLTGWSTVVATGRDGGGAIRTDGTLWMWGTNPSGQLGIADAIYRSSPTQVGTLTNWASMKAGWLHRVALKTDGTLWSWGVNTPGDRSGELGLGDAISRSSPTQIGTLATWRAIGGGSYYVPQALLG